MKFKLGGGDYLQPYDEKNGQYTDGDCLKVKEKDLENLVLKYIYGLDYKNLTFHFPNYKIHDEVYCELFIKYVRQFIKNDDVIIQPEKMKYLLLCKFKDDKSAFFKKIGYSEFDSERLMNDIRRNTKFETSSFKRINKYTFNFEAKTILNNYTVTTAWQLNEDGDVRLITVIPGGDKIWK